MTRLIPNSLTDLTHPMARLEQSMVRLERSMGELRDGMEPVQTLPEVVAVLGRMEKLMERLVVAAEADAGVTPPPAAVRAAPRKRGASA